MKNRYLWLFVGFFALMALLAVGLTRDPREIPSPLLGKPAPAFSLPRLDSGAPFSPEEMKGRVWLLNVWASWCVSCRAEHPLLVRLARERREILPIIGLNYKEARGDASLDMEKLDETAERRLIEERARQWLDTRGDPYVFSVMDADGRVGMDYGVYGVPETYLIDKGGVIRFKQIGPITPEALERDILPLAEKLRRESAAE
ncbi:MAG: DsbE family thiol:disulfide interchange protein [Zoogloeaceae bacterium]|nr:DsbE family thiol:disulfide interchange protein [Zoogloeaceae bacterium]